VFVGFCEVVILITESLTNPFNCKLEISCAKAVRFAARSNIISGIRSIAAEW
jgi:hypothetical protein